MTQASLPLTRVPIGERRMITGVDGPDHAELEREGLLAGTVVRVAARTPLGGPVIVEIGRVRVAVAAHVAAGVLTLPADVAPASPTGSAAPTGSAT